MTVSDMPRLPLQGSPPAGPRPRARLWAPTCVEEWILLAVVAVAIVIRALTIDNQSFWTDEALTAYEASLPFGAMLHTVAHVETTPPLFFVLEWGWAKLFGTGEVALRLISELAGIALVPLTYASGRELFSRWAGVIAAAFVAVNPFLVWYSQEARSYMLFAALTAAGFLWFVRALERPSRRHLGLWLLFSALALTTHFFAGFIVAPEALWLLWRHRRRDVLVAVGATAAVQLAMLPFAISDTGHGANWIAHVSRVHRLVTAMLEVGVSILNRRGTTPEAVIAWVALLALVAVLLALGGDRRTRAGVLLAGSIAAFVVAAPILVGFVGQDYFLTRNVIAAFVPLALVIAAACAAPRTRPVGIPLAVVLLAGFAAATYTVQTHGYLQRPEWRAVARTLGAAPVQRAVLVAGGTTADPLKIYMPGVHWVQPQGRHVTLAEIDIVGAFKRMVLRPAEPRPDPAGIPARSRSGRPLPVGRAPRGTRLLSRVRVHNWEVARFALLVPRRLDVRQLLLLAHRFFRHTPSSMLVFMQEPRQ